MAYATTLRTPRPIGAPLAARKEDYSSASRRRPLIKQLDPAASKGPRRFALAVRWAGHIAADVSASTFHATLAPICQVDAALHDTVRACAVGLSIGPGLACGAAGGLLALPTGIFLHQGVNCGYRLGATLTQALVEGSYRGSVVCLAIGAASLSLGVGAGVGALALTGALTCEALRQGAAQLAAARPRPLDAAAA